MKYYYYTNLSKKNDVSMFRRVELSNMLPSLTVAKKVMYGCYFERAVLNSL